MESVKKLGYELFEGKFAVYGQFIKFAAAGGFCALVEMVILISLKNIYQTEEVNSLLIFNGIAYGIAVVINYLISKAWVFESGKYSRGVEFMVFCAVALVGFGVNQLVFYASLITLSTEWYKVAKIIAIAMVVIWNFFAKKYLVFKG